MRSTPLRRSLSSGVGREDFSWKRAEAGMQGEEANFRRECKLLAKLVVQSRPSHDDGVPPPRLEIGGHGGPPQVLPKPNKPDYASPRAYRPIQLLECLGKLVEKTVARRLMFDCDKFSLMPPEQFGGVMAASCTDAGLSLTHDIENALNRGHTASLLTVDIKGFFDSINHRRLLLTLKDMDFPPVSYAGWIRSFPTARVCRR